MAGTENHQLIGSAPLASAAHSRTLFCMCFHAANPRSLDHPLHLVVSRSAAAAGAAVAAGSAIRVFPGHRLYLEHPIIVLFHRGEPSEDNLHALAAQLHQLAVELRDR